MNNTHDRLSVADAADLAGIRPSTWRAYVARRQAPPPDGRFSDRPWWRRATVDEWLALRRK